jgi:hypothetical protein
LIKKGSLGYPFSFFAKHFFGLKSDRPGLVAIHVS